ncbi:hypothetical protein AAIR98_001316 [Elusimicrobium simillimum]|uniref:hypothetical protein n=1 Tax=Elusimicrobium simillimum TaxID=3143438 RepID=UPI003C6EB0C1
MTQFFYKDNVELKFYGAAEDVFSKLKDELSLWFEKAYSDEQFGGVLYDNAVTPLTGVVARDIFVKHFNQIFEMWRYGGTFESYLYVFRHIFGEESQITFERAAPAHLKINIVSSKTGYFEWIVNKKVDNNIVDSGAIVERKDSLPVFFQQQLGITDFREVQGILNSLNPSGIFLEVDFSLINGGI